MKAHRFLFISLRSPDLLYFHEEDYSSLLFTTRYCFNTDYWNCLHSGKLVFRVHHQLLKARRFLPNTIFVTTSCELTFSVPQIRLLIIISIGVRHKMFVANNGNYYGSHPNPIKSPKRLRKECSNWTAKCGSGFLFTIIISLFFMSLSFDIYNDTLFLTNIVKLGKPWQDIEFGKSANGTTTQQSTELTVAGVSILTSSNQTTDEAIDPLITTGYTIPPLDKQQEQNSSLHLKLADDFIFIPSNKSITNTSISPKQSCIIFSCSPPNYYLVEENLNANTNKYCDRLHIYAETYNKDNIKIAPNWCRVAILESISHWLRGYKRIFYTDLDTVYDEKEVARIPCGGKHGEGLKGITMSSKTENGTDVLRTNWMLICNSSNMAVRNLLKEWAKKWKNIILQDQAVFNLNWGCRDVHCIQDTRVVEKAHCGGYMKQDVRQNCMRKKY